ncbi:MAG: UvrD-helicase domain-containing protein [Nitrospirae bacterium]|nr:UvrD-helicase domain-containing protein [Nitrospirota bacterium]
MNEQLPDSEARQQAWEGTEQNLMIEAAAGTGKTEVLAFHYLSRLFSRNRSFSPGRPLTPEEIVAITFTDKAAAEMRLRISEHLARIASGLPWDPHPPATEAERAGRLRALLDHVECGPDRAAEMSRDSLRRLERSRIGTMHSFCAHLLRMHPVESGVDPGFGVDSGAEFDRVFDVEWEKWARKILSKPGDPALRTILTEFSLPDLKAFAKSLSAHLRPDDLAESLGGQGRDPAASDSPILQAVRLLDPFAKQTRELFIRKGFLPFDALLSRSVRLLRSHPTIRKQIRQDFRAILVDEFQDTDPIQAEIVLWLSGERDHPPNPACPMGRWSLERGRLFVVGDPKQSVYSFRNADVAIYETVKEILRANSAHLLYLQTNFRSAPAILHASNAIFSHVFQGPDNPRHVPLMLQPGHEGLPGAVELHWCETGDADAEKAGDLEGAALAQWLRESIEPEITQPDGTVEWGRAAILARKMTTISPILDRLRQSGIPHSVHGTKHFYARPEVTDFLNLLQAIDNPADRTSLAGVLRSPLGGCTDQDLLDLKLLGGLDYATAGKKLPAGVRWLYDVLADLHRSSERRTLEEVVDLALNRLPVLEIASAGYDGEQAVANLLKIRRLASEEGAMGRSLRAFVFGMRRRRRDLEEEAESPISEESMDALHVLTIHQAKGLEYDVVIVPMMNQGIQLRSDKTARVTWNPFRNFTAAVLGEWNTGDVEALETLGEQLAGQEARRLLYVATTRARKRLAFWGTSRQGVRSKLPLMGILQEVPGFREALATAGDGPTLFRPDEEAMIQIRRIGAPDASESGRRNIAAAPRSLSIPPDYAERWKARMEDHRTRQNRPLFLSPSSAGTSDAHRGPALHPAPSPNSTHGSHPLSARRPWTWDLREAKQGPRAEGRTALLIGSLCHATLMRMDFTQPTDLARWVEQAGAQTTIEAGPVPADALNAARGILDRFLESVVFADLARAEILARELPFIRRMDDGRVLRGAIDVVYRLDGKIIVADYKTDAISGKAAIQERVLAYADQLRPYRDAVADGLGEKPLAQIIFLRPGIAVPVPLD